MQPPLRKSLLFFLSFPLSFVQRLSKALCFKKSLPSLTLVPHICTMGDQKLLSPETNVLEIIYKIFDITIQRHLTNCNVLVRWELRHFWYRGIVSYLLSSEVSDLLFQTAFHYYFHVAIILNLWPPRCFFVCFQISEAKIEQTIPKNASGPKLLVGETFKEEIVWEI
jgi:hypothetical protein